MGSKNVATLELEFYIKLFKRHTEELFLLINDKNVLIFMHIYKATYVLTLFEKRLKMVFKTVSFHSKLKIQGVPINMGIQRRY